MSANRLNSGEMSQGSPKQSGTRGTKVREPGELGKFVPDGPKENGTSGLRVCEPVGSAEMRTNSPEAFVTKGRVGHG
ncbi:hypothetical protein KI387_033969 [Taxus chinensis]|uniref:Uncharacterized protein n=1 Tax=Taxus chinensis TaxID=29808 RepID=A0AA38C4G2_TAXCH|nr:hypothetical protein KI387_033969 [Taxus chinensis]